MKVVKIEKEDLSRFKRVLKFRGNKADCSNQTGLSRMTIDRALTKKNCSEQTLEKLMDYCYAW
jgi:hypothetical protein